MLSAYIGRRLSLRPGGASRPSAGSFVAVTGISLAMIIMLIAVSVVTGFKKEIRDKVVGFNSQIALYPADSYSDSLYTSGLTLDNGLLEVIHRTLPGSTTTLMIRQPAIFKTDDAFQGVVLKGFDSGESLDFLRHNMAGGALPQDIAKGSMPDSLVNSTVISRTTANALNLSVGDRLNVHFLLDNDVRTRRLTVRGIYDTHFSDFDRLYAFTPIEFLQRLNHIDSITGNAIDINGIAESELPEAANRLNQALIQAAVTGEIKGDYHVSSVLETNAIYFNWLDLLDTNVVVIIILMTLVSAFTLISSLFIIILERVNTIGLLKALGAPTSLIRQIFIYLSERLVIRGILIGDIVGVGIIILQQQTHFLRLDPEAYYLTYVPAELNWWFVAALSIGALIISCAVLILPSAAIARMEPAKSLRYE